MADRPNSSKAEGSILNNQLEFYSLSPQIGDKAPVIIVLEEMGTSSSNLLDEDDAKRNVLANKSLYELNTTELKILLENNPLKLEEIKVVGQSMKEQLKKNSDAAADQKTSWFYADDANSPQATLAAHLHTESKDLAKIRFSLVPSKLKEPIFWQATFLLLEERLEEYNDRFQSQLEDEEWTACEQSHDDTSLYSSDDDDDDDDASYVDNDNGSYYGNGEGLPYEQMSETTIEHELAKRDEQILDLMKQVEALQNALQQKEQQTKSQQHRHPGEWVMHEDCKEFLEYPEEIKENFRKEKQRRIRQVCDEMKFIVDSDKIEDSNGQWSCCGTTTYKAPCICKVRNER